MRGYRAISDWAEALSQKSRARFNCKRQKGKYIVPSNFIIRDLLTQKKVGILPVKGSDKVKQTNEIKTAIPLLEQIDITGKDITSDALLTQRETIRKKSGKLSREIAYGITSRTKEEASAERVLAISRGHWSIENNCHYIIGWNFDEDRSRIKTGHGPENITRLRRFAVSILKSRGVKNIAQKMRKLLHNTRIVFDYLKMTENSCAVVAGG